MNLIKSAVALAISTFVAHPALATDLIAPISNSAAYDWSGFYAGIVASGGQFSSTTTEHGNSIFGGGASRSELGGAIGGTVGVNVQSGAMVFGVEGDASWSSLGYDMAYSDTVTENNSHWDWLATLRARAGLAVDNALLYVTAGVALVDTDYFYGRKDLLAGMYVRSSGTEVGIAAGAGAEYALADNMSVKAEYLYISPTSTSAFSDFSEQVDFQSSAHLARLGLNFQF